MQRLKRAIKKMAAIGTGVAMLGATMTGALAQDLADYPAPFVDANGVFDESTAIIVGDNAAASDTLGAVDIATNLQFMAKTPVQSGAGTVQVSGGVTEDIPLDEPIAVSTLYTFDKQLTDDDIDSFMDTTVQFQGKDYDIHDELLITNDYPRIETSLSSTDDDYESNVFMETTEEAIYYLLFSDEGTLNISKATSTQAFEVKFLGKTLKITDVEDGYENRFTAYVGTEYFMDVGDVVTVEGKKVTLVNVGSGGSVIVDVDGTLDTIPAATTETVNGIEVTVDETFYASLKSERAASLVVGKDAQATYQDGDPYVGEDPSDPNWVWDIGNLGNVAQTTVVVTSAVDLTTAAAPYIGIHNAFEALSDEDDVIGVGECWELPNNYVSICLDSLTVSETDYEPLTIRYKDSIPIKKSEDVRIGVNPGGLYLSMPGPNRFKIPKDYLSKSNGSLNTAADIKTNEIWIARRSWSNMQPEYGIYYRDEDHLPNIRLAGSVNSTGAGSIAGANTFAVINYKDTKDKNINLTLFNTSTTMVNLVLDINGDSADELDATADDIYINFSTATGGNFTGMGLTQGEYDKHDVIWRQDVELGSKDEDHRSIYGIVIKDPKANAGSDQVVLEIPGDQVQANVVIKGQAATVAGGAVSYIPADITIDTKLSSEVTGSETAHHLILVGGPCANPTVEAVSSLGLTCAGWDLGPGEAVVKMASNGNKVALLIAGTDAVDTRMAAKVVANYEDYDLSGSSVVVTGSLSAPILKVA